VPVENASAATRRREVRSFLSILISGWGTGPANGKFSAASGVN
jgi:hypothetical protein